MRQAAAYSLPDMKSLGKRCSPPRWLRQAAFGNSASGYPRRRGIAFGLYPAKCAARLDPAAAIRFE